ncbi:MAG: ATP-dependent DNA helicase RecG [Patescibacteria group bacterium]|nr:ATP-dependent DNA helicase RecG [Patescibacteria group bacterium]
MSKIPLETPLRELHGVGPRFVSKLSKLGIHTVRDLLWHFPSRYEDWSKVAKISELKAGDAFTVRARVAEIGVKRAWKRRMLIVEALLEDDSGSIQATWFNQPYIKNVLKPGTIASFAGKVALRKNKLYLSSPTYELNAGDSSKHTGRLVPIYPETKGLTSKGLRFLTQPILESVEPVKEFLPEKVLEEHNLPEVNEALHMVHFPDKLSEAQDARRRFAFEDLFLLHLNNIILRLALFKKSSPKIDAPAHRVKEIVSGLPFELTASQKETLDEILDDMAESHPMNRLLQGDVGSGKTIIAGIAALIAAEQEFQVALMAPTEILARQHYKTVLKFFGETNKGVGLLISKEARVHYGNSLEEAVAKPALIKELSANRIKILVGTHALIQKSVKFDNLGLIIIDEQHRFGVAQRGALADKKGKLPHFLSMSATPIPRTLMMTVFGDLDVSLIKELPKGRKPIITKIIAPENRNKAYGFIKGQVQRGRQAFVICPRIDPSEGDSLLTAEETKKLEMKSVKEEHEKLSKRFFPDFKVAMLHGKMASKEKEETMKEFAAGRIDILVSTSVIEVGIDVPNATIMMIESADRFGLAQLYQFRGRVGRGEHQSFCFLFAESGSGTSYKRLNSLLTAKNGFELAEKDLAIRGPGEFLGEEQAGMPDIAMKSLNNLELVKDTRKAAEETLKASPSLRDFPELKKRINAFSKEIHLE